jgi:hypothetical protein
LWSRPEFPLEHVAIVGYANLSLVGKPVPMKTGEAFGAANAALVPPVRIEEFYMTSVSPAV